MKLLLERLLHRISFVALITLLGMLFYAGCVSGCSTRTVKYNFATKDATYDSKRFLTKENFKEVSIGTNGTVKIEGYQSDQVEALKAGIELGKTLK